MSRFAKLIDLAQTQDSGQRRELLREVTDLFFESADGRTDRESELFDDVLKLVAAEMQDNVLVELSERFADAQEPPIGLLRDLAMHSFEVAGPILQRSTALDDQTLLQVVAYQSQQHIKAVAQRETVSEVISAAIVKHGDDYALGALINNDGAKLSRATMETVVDRAAKNTMLHEGVIRRRDVPLDLLNEMYFVVETRLREQIMQRNASVDPAELDAALSKARSRIRKTQAELNLEMRKAQTFINAKKAANELNARLLVSLYREDKITHFIYGLAEITGVDSDTVSELVERKDVDGIAMICRASNIERPLFVTIAALVSAAEDAMSKAEEFGKMYNSVPIEAAQRALRFFKVRKSAGPGMAA